MGVRREGWQVPALFVAIVTLAVVIASVLANAPPRSGNPVRSPDGAPPSTSAPSELRGTWADTHALVTATLYDVSCADPSHCVAVGAAGIILRTGNGGISWAADSPGNQHSLIGVSCPSSTVCFAVTNYGEVLSTLDGGQTWSLSTLSDSSINDISCPTTVDCFTASGFETHDGANGWHQTSKLGAVNIECPARTVCYAARETETTHGEIVANRTNGWSRQAVTPRFLNAISCSGIDSCIAAGGGAWGSNILRTVDGQKWSVQYVTASGQTLFDVGCMTVDSCAVVDGTANVLATMNHGQTWTTQSTGLAGRLYAISCPSSDSCFAVGSAPNSIGGGIIVHYQAPIGR